MGRLVYSAICSLDGYTVDAEGSFDWCAPDEEVHAFINERERSIGTYWYGRRMYEVMRYWETVEPGQGEIEDDYARIWRAADKVVFSTTLEGVTTSRTTLERTFDVHRHVDGDVGIGGPTLGAAALRAGVVDELQLFLNPIVVGGGTPALPEGMRQELELLETRAFASGVVFLRYQALR